MDGSDKNKRCPMCAEDIRVEASICRYCGTDVYNETDVKKGSFVKVSVKAGESIYKGDLFAREQTNRASDILNDKRRFLSLVNTYKEVKAGEVKIGYIALNKNSIEWLRIVTPDLHR